MSGFRPCNQRAVFVPMVLLGVLGCLVAPAAGAVHLVDETGATGQNFGAALSGVPDLNGDGRDEFLVGSPNDGTDRGAVFFWYGGLNLTVAPDGLWTGAADADFFGWAVARIGDVNKGGKDDWAIGAPAIGTARAGKVYVYFGEQPLSQTPITFAGVSADDQFGFSVSAAGDFNADGEDDFIIGAPYDDEAGLDAGAAYVVFGNNGSAPSTDLGDALKLTGELADNQFGWAVTDAGNFLGGADCVAVGAPRNDSHFGTEAGAVYVYEGAATPDAGYDHLIGPGGTAPYSLYGFSLDNAGRWDADSYDDLVVGAPTNVVSASRPGRIEIVFGDPNPSDSGDRYVEGEVARGQFGYCVAGVGNADDAGSDDVVTGSPYLDLDGTDAGRAYFYAGGSSSLANASGIALASTPLQDATQADDRCGYGVGWTGDFDGDLVPDYAVGAPGGNDIDNVPSGYVQLVASEDLVVAAAVSSWQAAWIADAGIALEFRLGTDAAAAELTLLRYDRDADGAVLRETELWSGPAILAGEDLPGVLVTAGDGFHFLDPTPALPAAADDGIGYELILTRDGQDYSLGILAGPGPLPDALPVVLKLAPAWPNPFNPSTQIRFEAPAGSSLQVRVTDVRGRVVRELYTGTGTATEQRVIWDGRGDAGRLVASGLYFIQLSSPGRTLTQRVVLAK